MEVQRETFKEANNSTQNLILFDSIQGLCEQVNKFSTEHEIRHTKLDKSVKTSGRVNKALTVTSGLVGGFLAFFGSKYLGG
jgi:uncharacterized membrane protein YjjP (DUF1212 family)